GREMDAVLPPSGPWLPRAMQGLTIESIACYGNALYFTTHKKIYKAISPTPGTIEIVYVRDLLPVELQQVARLFSQERDGVEYVYRACDDPIRDGIPITVNDG
ncbi:hypothetical protein PENTCL1PPCAC_5512, partial [Pristionchus entomophagus]